MSLPARRPALPDASDRKRAATVFDRNLVVTAGAGTGKTALIVERALNLIAAGVTTVDAIAAITFTEKAAAELRLRLASGLAALSDLASRGAEVDAAGAGTEAGRAFGWLREEAGVPLGMIARRTRAALLGLDAAPVTTIHAFCSEILKRHPREAGVDPSFVVDEGPGFDALFDEEWERFLVEELGGAAPRAETWRRALLVPDALASVRDLARAFAEFSLPDEAVAPGASYVPAPHLALFGAEAGAARDAALAIVTHEPPGMNPRMKEFLAAGVDFLTAFLKGGPAAMVAADGTLPLDEFTRKSVPAPGAKVDRTEAAAVARAAAKAQALVRIFARVDEEAVGALVDAALPIASRAREALLARGLVSFDALLRLTRDLLAKHPGIRRDLAARHRTLLVDEFQDTDPLQYEILFFIAEAEGAAAADAYGARLAPGRLFIVGDPKQSIYRFRGADIEAYERAVSRVLEDGEMLTLATSFRAPAEIVEPINTLFGGWIRREEPGDEAYEPRYAPIASARGAAGGAARVEIWSVDAQGDATDRRRSEAAAIAAWIAERRGTEDPSGRALDYRDVAILLRALTNAGLYAQALRQAGIPFVVEGGRGFYERPEVGDLIAFLRAAANPNDAASVLAVMRSPLGAAPDEELARFAAGGGRLDRPDPDRKDAALHPNVFRTLDLLASFRARMSGRAPDDVIRDALERTPLALLHASCFEGAQRVANLRKLVARAEDLARRGMSLEEAVGFIEEEFAAERTEGESPLADETVDAVRILSVHKAKGLEYPVVFLPDVGREPNRSRGAGTSVAWLRSATAGFAAVRLDDGSTNLAWARLVESNLRHEAAEEKRVFYVGCTRARERLILVNSGRKREAAWRDALRFLEYEASEEFPPEGPLAGGAVLHRILAPVEAAGPPSARELDPAWAAAAEKFLVAASSAAAAAASPIRWPAGARDERAAGVAGPRDDADALLHGEAGAAPRDLARLAGTAVHAALERWDFADPDALRRAGREAASSAVADQHPDSSATAVEERTRAVSAEAEAILDAFLATALPARLAALHASARVLGREVPVIHRDAAGSTWAGACDLIYRDAGGAIVVADYKTDKVGPEGAAAIAERYREQIRVYVEAVARAHPGAVVRGETLFVRTGVAVTLF